MNELVYARNKKKKIILIKVENYQPTEAGILEFVITGKLYYEIYKDYIATVKQLLNGMYANILIFRLDRISHIFLDIDIHFLQPNHAHKVFVFCRVSLSSYYDKNIGCYAEIVASGLEIKKLWRRTS
jgi:hypothetical protein